MGSAVLDVLEGMTLADLVLRMERSKTDPPTRSLLTLRRAAVAST
jgi:hypothetical protein